MFGSIGFTEILVIAAVALVILGPDKFPGHAKIAMRFFRDIRGYWDEAKRDLAQELKPVKKEIKELEKYKPEDYLDSMTMDRSEDTSYDGQGYPGTGKSTPDASKNAATGSTESAPTEPPAAESKPADAPSNPSVDGTEPYTPDADYVDESQRYPD